VQYVIFSFGVHRNKKEGLLGFLVEVHNDSLQFEQLLDDETHINLFRHISVEAREFPHNKLDLDVDLVFDELLRFAVRCHKSQLQSQLLLLEVLLDGTES
jgi:hypothetical protein